MSAAWAGDKQRFPASSVLLVIASLVCTVAWSYLVVTRVPAAALALLNATACAWTSLTLLPRASVLAPTPLVVVETAVSLYAGWLAVASTLTLALAFPETFDRPPLLTVASLAVSTGAVLIEAPAAALPVAWACLLQRTASAYSVAGALVAIGGAVAALKRDGASG